MQFPTCQFHVFLCGTPGRPTLLQKLEESVVVWRTSAAVGSDLGLNHGVTAAWTSSVCEQ